MATTYKLVQRRDMHKGATEGDKLYYAQAKSTGTSDMERLCSMIGERSCVSSADVKAVLDALMTVIKRNLANGSPIRLGDLGSFRPSVSGIGSENVDKFTASNVKKARVIYVPSAEIKEAVAMYAFSKVGATAEGGNTEKPGGGDIDNPGGGDEEAPDPTV